MKGFRNKYKGHMYKTKGFGAGREVGMAEVCGGEVGGKCRQLYLNNNKIIFKKEKIKTETEGVYH